MYLHICRYMPGTHISIRIPLAYIHSRKYPYISTQAVRDQRHLKEKEGGG